jgi:hypothetical protein
MEVENFSRARLLISNETYTAGQIISASQFPSPVEQGMSEGLQLSGYRTKVRQTITTAAVS